MPSLPLASPVSGRSSTVYGIFIGPLRLFRLELWTEVAGRTRDAVFVGPAVHDRLAQEVAVSRRRRRGPLQRGRIPRVPIDRFPPLDAREEIDDERDLEETERPR